MPGPQCVKIWTSNKLVSAIESKLLCNECLKFFISNDLVHNVHMKSAANSMVTQEQTVKCDKTTRN